MGTARQCREQRRRNTEPLRRTAPVIAPLIGLSRTLRTLPPNFGWASGGCPRRISGPPAGSEDQVRQVAQASIALFGLRHGLVRCGPCLVLRGFTGRSHTGLMHMPNGAAAGCGRPVVVRLTCGYFSAQFGQVPSQLDLSPRPVPSRGPVFIPRPSAGAFHLPP